MRRWFIDSVETATHTTPIRQMEASEIIQGKDPAMCYGPQEESHPPWHLDFPNPLPWEVRRSCTPDLKIEEPSIKLTVPTKTPMGFIPPNTSWDPRLNEF